MATLKGNRGRGEYPHGRFVDEVGKRYGRLIVTARNYETQPRRGAKWLCRCDCGNSVATSGHSLRTGNTESCGCKRLDTLRERLSLPSGVGAMNRAVANTAANATRRGYEWSLTTEDAAKLMAMDCHYCGLPPSQVSRGRNGNYTYTGIDRVDNALGYILSNVVPCCSMCNGAKNRYSRDAFLAWVERVYRHSVLNTTNGHGGIK